MTTFAIFANGQPWGHWTADTAEQAIQMAADECGTVDVGQDHASTEGMTAVPMTEAAANFLAQNPTLLLTIGEYKLWEHPTRGDTAPVYMTTPDGRLINTGFYDTGDFDLALCEELAANQPFPAPAA